MNKTSTAIRASFALLMLAGLCVGLYFLLASFGSPLYAMFIPVILLIYLPISWGCRTELNVQKDTQSWPAVFRFFWRIPLTLYQKVFCFPGFFICKAFRDVKQLKKGAPNPLSRATS